MAQFLRCFFFNFFLDFPYSWDSAPYPDDVERDLEGNLHLLAEQYRLKSGLFKTKHLLVLLGDDFKYSNKVLWRIQIDNYRKIIEIFDRKPEYKIKAKFSTLSDYFERLDYCFSFFKLFFSAYFFCHKIAICN